MKSLSEQLAQQNQLSAQQLEQRHGIADDLTVPRAIDHSGVVPDEASADGARRELDALGYEASITDGHEYIFLEARKFSAVDPASVDRFTEEVLTIFHRFGGDYDGWGGPVVTMQPVTAPRQRSWIERLIRKG